MQKRTEEMNKFIIDHYKELDPQELAEAINEKFGCNYTPRRISEIRNELGLKGGKRLLKGSYIFTKEIEDYIEQNYKNRSTYELTDMINAKFGTSYTRQQLRTYTRSRRMRSEYCMSSDGKSPLIGRKVSKEQYEKMSKHFFKKGHTPKKKAPVGTVHIDRNGMHLIKVAEPSVWRLEHLVIWEKHYGKIPEGYRVIFRDKNKNNLSIDNLMLVSKEELAIMSIKGYYSEDKDITECGAAYAKLRLEMKRIKKENDI